MTESKTPWPLFHTRARSLLLLTSVALSSSSRSNAFHHSAIRLRVRHRHFNFAVTRTAASNTCHIQPKRSPWSYSSDSRLYHCASSSGASSNTEKDNNRTQHAPSCPTSFIVSYDGAIVTNNARAKCRLCLGVALEMWPELLELLPDSTIGADYPLNETDGEQNAWILNKMEVLVPAMSNGGTDPEGLSAMVDLVMLARLILEEQRLDNGRNVGRGGKYGGKYHPQAMQQQESAGSGSSIPTTNPVGSRPLTVGEIAANWIEGGHLRDTIRARYNVQKRDPFPIAREHLVEAMGKSKNGDCFAKGATLNRQLLQMMENSDDATILLDHESRRTEALRCIREAGVGSSMSSEIVAPSSPDESELDMLTKAIMAADCDHPKRICVIHHSISVLRRLKNLYGEDSPVLRDGYAPILDTLIELGLFLPAWADCTGPQQESDATMDPWLNVMTEKDLTCLFDSQAEINAWE